MRNLITLLSLAAVLTVGAVAFDEKAAGKEVTLTGCLNKGPADGQYVLMANAQQAMLTGATDLEKHANHTIRVTGSWENAADGKKQFRVAKIDHVSESCQAPPPASK